MPPRFPDAGLDYDPTHAVFRDLMDFRVRDVLLVSSRYDSFILEEDGQLSESLNAEYYQHGLSSTPRITQVSTGAEALDLLAAREFDLVITMTRLGGMDVIRFAREVKERRPDQPIVLLADNPPDANRIKAQNHPPVLDQIFVWQGHVAIFLAIIKFIEDRINVEADCRAAGVRTIILIENSVRFYSSYLPLLYGELMNQTHALLADGVNVRQRLRRMKARAKVLLAENFEEAWELFVTYREYTLGVISDARYPRNGRSDPQAGVEFVRRVKDLDPDMPVLLQSSDQDVAEDARRLGAAFVNKRSPSLLEELRRFMQVSLGFGDFVFVLPDGTEVARVSDIAGMTRALKEVPEESLRYHAARNHFSNWCMARTEFGLAAQLRPIKVNEFPSIEELRNYLIGNFTGLHSAVRRGVVVEFSPEQFDGLKGIVRIGGGSMGGKGRGLAFLNSLLWREEAQAGPGGVRICVPPAAVIGTDVFDQFLQVNHLSSLALSDAPDDEIDRAFTAGEFPASTIGDLRILAGRLTTPLAVRSSSLLEDSHDQPFAGIYRTLMLPNNAGNRDTRFAALLRAVKLVYASTFSRNAKAYLANTPHRSEEEKMAVVIQPLVGRAFGRYFYPDFAGVARSYNYYPVFDLQAEDGIAVVALGFGRTVVEGRRAIRFCPTAPQMLPQFSSTQDILRNAQREFYALDLEAGAATHDGGDALVELDLETAEADGTLSAIGSTYSPDNDVVYDGISRSGIRLATFAPVLKRGSFPLPAILMRLLNLCREAMSCPVEMEFAVNSKGLGGTPEFAVVQVRPMVIEVGTENLEEALRTISREEILCSSEQALGHGRVREITDIIYVRPETFDRAKTEAVAQEVGEINRKLQAAERPYLLIGPGRWGTSDRWLGVPVEWRQIAGVRAIVETDLDDVPVTPSEGTHFFQNLTSFGVGYFTVHRREGGGWVDYGWLDSLPAVEETVYLRHVRTERPLDLRIDGRLRRGVVLK